MPVVVILILSEDRSGVSLVHDQNVVEDLSADGADHSLAMGIHARSVGRAEQHVHLLGTAQGLVDGSGVVVSGRVCGGVDGLKLDWGEATEAALSASAVVGLLDPGHDRQAQLLAGGPALAVEHILLQQREE